MTAQVPRLGQVSWALYDWANSAFSAVIITFVYATYFSQGIAENEVDGTAQWGWAMTASGIAIALASPVLGAIADAGGRRKPWLFAFTLLTVIGCFLLWFGRPVPEVALMVLVIAALTNVAFEIAGVFYNAMLPELVSRDYIGRLSGWAWGLGYAGGLVCLIVTLFAFVQAEHPLFGLGQQQAEDVRISGPLVGLWLAVFSLPLFLFTPDRPNHRLPAAEAIPRRRRHLRDGHGRGNQVRDPAERHRRARCARVRLGRRLDRREAHHPDRAGRPPGLRRGGGPRDRPAAFLDRRRAARRLRRADPGGEPLADGPDGATRDAHPDVRAVRADRQDHRLPRAVLPRHRDLVDRQPAPRHRHDPGLLRDRHD